MVPWFQRFSFAAKRRDKREKEAARLRVSIKIMTSINKQPITTHLSVNKPIRVCCKVPPIRRQGHIMTLFKSIGTVRSVNCRGQPEVFSPSFSFFSSRLNLHGPSLRKPLAPRVEYQEHLFKYLSLVYSRVDTCR